jgi:putative membrane protein
LSDTEIIMKTRWILIIGGVILAVVLLGVFGPWLLPTTFGGSGYGGMMGPGMMGGYGMMGGFSWLGMLTMLLFWIGLIALIVWALINLFPARQATVEPDAEEILKRRYARGEISQEEFVQAREALQ